MLDWYTKKAMLVFLEFANEVCKEQVDGEKLVREIECGLKKLLDSKYHRTPSDVIVFTHGTEHTYGITDFYYKTVYKKELRKAYSKGNNSLWFITKFYLHNVQLFSVGISCSANGKIDVDLDGEIDLLNSENVVEECEIFLDLKLINYIKNSNKIKSEFEKVLKGE